MSWARRVPRNDAALYRDGVGWAAMFNPAALVIADGAVADLQDAAVEPNARGIADSAVAGDRAVHNVYRTAIRQDVKVVYSGCTVARNRTVDDVGETAVIPVVQPCECVVPQRALDQIQRAEITKDGAASLIISECAEADPRGSQTPF